MTRAILSHLRKWPWAPGLQILSQKTSLGLQFGLRDPAPGQARQCGCRRSFLGAGSRDFFTWFLVHLLQAFTPVPQVASENCSDIPRVWCGPQLRAWCGPWPGPTLASALSLRSPSPSLPSWEAVSGREQNLRSQSGQNWVRFPCCRRGGVSQTRLSLAALGPEADARTVPSHRPLPAGEALWAWTVEVPAVWPAPLSSPTSPGPFCSSLRPHPLSVGRGLSHECC